MSQPSTTATQSRRSKKTSVDPKLLDLVVIALFIALTYLATAFINIRLPFFPANGGLVHLGNVPVFVAAALYGKKHGALAGAIGLGLFDLTSGWVAWAPFTVVVCGLIGYTFGVITEKHKTVPYYVLAVLAALAIKIVGYYIAEGVIYGNWIAPATSIPGNVVQILTAGVLSVPLIAALQRTLGGRLPGLSKAEPAKEEDHE